MKVRVWLNPQGCKVITMDAKTRDLWFLGYAKHQRIPPAGIYHVAGFTDLFYMVDFAGIRSTTACQQPISRKEAMAITAINETTGVGDVSVGGTAIPKICTFEFEIPDNVLGSLAECSDVIQHSGNYAKHDIQIPGNVRGTVVRKQVYKCWTGSALPTLNRVLEQWIKTVIHHPFEDVLFRCTCRRWRLVPPTTVSGLLKTGKSETTRTATVRIDTNWSTTHTIAGYMLRAGTTVVQIITGQLYKVNNVLHARLELLADCKLSSSDSKWQPCTLTSPEEYSCNVVGIEAVNDGFLNQLIRYRVAVLRNGELFLQVHVPKIKIACALVKAYWGIFVLSKSNTLRANQSSGNVVPRRVQSTQTRGNKLSVPKCFQAASVYKDGKLLNKLRLDMSSIVKTIYNRTGRNIATPFFFRQLAKARFKQDRIKTLGQVIKRDLANGTKPVGIQSCRKRQTSTDAHKLKCPYNTMDGNALELCASDCGHTHLHTNSMSGFNPADMAVGLKIPKQLIASKYTATSGPVVMQHTFNDISN